ncbi:glycosyltransferase [Laspinema olomoucense]|uniref:Glycosyltransferase n=1 Tax=Laspinema olomoucense D3b TaxID=2953688 RepID=A0ABT2NBM2_9CYAN|nr:MULTISPECIES: glycosyltransferase [unclassified Laspinema]MCT7980094.1 glycosyltransferase [Laspinema sp. D3b]
MNAPMVSAIIVVKNGERYIARAIDSIMAQTFKDYEIIVVDGHSSDRTLNIAQSYPQVRCVQQKKPGIAEAYNLGIESARGEFIAFLSHDDVWTSNKLSTQINYLLEHPEIQYSVAKVKFILEEGHSIPPGFKPELFEGDRIAYIMETLVARKSLFDSVGKFNSNFTIANDVDWFSRVKDLNISVIAIPEVFLHKYIHDTNLSNQAQVNNQDLLKLLRQSIERKKQKAEG